MKGKADRRMGGELAEAFLREWQGGDTGETIQL